MAEHKYDLNLSLTEAEGTVLRGAIEGLHSNLLPRIADPEVNAEFQIVKAILEKLTAEEKIVEGCHVVDDIVDGTY